MGRSKSFALAASLGAVAAMPMAAAQPKMVQCGQQYQAAKVAGTLNGMGWTQYRTNCAARLKAEPASIPEVLPAAAAAAIAATPIPAAPPVVAAAASGAASPAASAKTSAPIGGGRAAMPGGRAAMLVREKQCGAEWRAQKAALVSRTPGLTWPRYWSQCNARLKASGP